MSNSEFKPKFGRPKTDRGITSKRVTRLVVKAAKRQRATNSPWANALTKRPVAELGRGKGAVYGLSPPQPGWRRVIVKARIARHGTSDLAAARAHQHYIMRDGVARRAGCGWASEGASKASGRGQLYDRAHDIADGGDFLDNQKGDTYQFRLIVAPEDGARMAALKPFIRDLMIDMEQDLRTKLDWVAVDHYNTGHPHTHVIIAGHDDCGEDLVMARHYISHGIRTRARDLVTLELGPEQEFERVIKLAHEMKAERFTSLDYGILKDAQENVLVISAMVDGTRGRQALRVGRLRHLQQMGLAEEKKTGVWIIDPQLEAKLRSMGERVDIIATMNRAMREHGMHRAAGDFAIFSGAKKSQPTIGKVLEVGIADEMTDRKFIVVDGIDGRIHYAEASRFTEDMMPQPGMIVALTGSGGKGKLRTAQIALVSTWPIEKLRTVDAATWLDQTIVAEKRPVIHEKGFGLDVAKAIAAREDWLIANGLARSDMAGTITPNPDMLQNLHQRAVARIAATLTTEYQLPHISLIEGRRITGQHIRTIDLPLQRLGVIKSSTAFTLVPWRPELAKIQGRDIEISMQNQQITIALARGRSRDIGLSR